MAVNRNFRTCPSSGLVFHEPAEKLMRWNAVLAVVFLLIGGILAIGVVLTRWQAVHLLDASSFYQVLTAHGLNMLVFWIIFFEIAVLYFAASTLLRCRIATPGMAWAAFSTRFQSACRSWRESASTVQFEGTARASWTRGGREASNILTTSSTIGPTASGAGSAPAGRA